MKCRVDDNKDQCSCTSTDCERRGICCECLRAHLAQQSLPSCMRELDWIQTTA